MVEKSVPADREQEGEEAEAESAFDTEVESGATIEEGSHNIVKRSNMSLANIFFKVSVPSHS